MERQARGEPEIVHVYENSGSSETDPEPGSSEALEEQADQTGDARDARDDKPDATTDDAPAPSEDLGAQRPHDFRRKKRNKRHG